jgi:hypothetical protein
LHFNVDELNNVLIAWTGAPNLPFEFLFIRSTHTNDFMVHVLDKTIEIPYIWSRDRIIDNLNISVNTDGFGFGMP